MSARLAVPSWSSYSATLHLARAIHGNADLRGVWMTMLAAYFDASHMGRGSGRTYAVAGFGGTVAEWLKFEGPWRKVLARVGIPELHMTDVAAKAKEGYRHLTPADYRLLMETLHRLLKNHAAVSFARVIAGEDLFRLTADGVKPLVIAGTDAMRAVQVWQGRRSVRKRSAHDIEDVVFDCGEPGRGALVDATPEGMDAPIFKDSRKVLPLQAADWLAWELARLDLLHKKHRGHGGAKPVAVRGTVWAAVRHFPRDWKYYKQGKWLDIFMDQPLAARIRRSLSDPWAR